MVLCIKLKDSLKIKPHPFLVEDASEKIVAWPGDTAGILFGSVYIGTPYIVLAATLLHIDLSMPVLSRWKQSRQKDIPNAN